MLRDLPVPVAPMTARFLVNRVLLGKVITRPSSVIPRISCSVLLQEVISKQDSASFVLMNDAVP